MFVAIHYKYPPFCTIFNSVISTPLTIAEKVNVKDRYEYLSFSYFSYSAESKFRSRHWKPGTTIKLSVKDYFFAFSLESFWCIRTAIHSIVANNSSRIWFYKAESMNIIIVVNKWKI